jgi:hypothetical protein
MKTLLKESYKATKKSTGIDPSKPGSIREILVNDEHFDTYIRNLSEGVEDKDQTAFRVLSENTRRALLENSMYQLNPYETLALPLLRVFFPKTVAKELVTVIPMDKPEIVRGFVRATFKRFGDATSYQAPSNTDISRGPDITVPLASAVAVPGTHDLLALAGLNSDIAHIEKDFTITGVTIDDGDDSTENINVNITPTVDGEFSSSITNTDGNVTSTLTGRINLKTGVVEVACVGTAITAIAFTSTVSLEENTINPRVTFNIDKLRLIAKDRQISTEWTIQMEQDIKALFNVDIQAELVSVIGQQIVLDVDREIVHSLLYACERLNGATHNKTFDKNPASYSPNYTWGPKQWMENVLPVLNDLSAAVYTDTNIAAANVLACNPLDATIFESLNEFRYTGKSDEDGVVGYESATVANGKWKMLVSSVVPQGKVLNLYKPAEEMKAVYIFAPYVPAVLTPYPLGNVPSLTVLSRYGTQLIRPQGISVLNIIQTT